MATFLEQYASNQFNAGVLALQTNNLTTILILGATKSTTTNTTRIFTYTSSNYTTAMVSDGFATTSPEYVIAQSILTQTTKNYTPTKVFVGQVLASDLTGHTQPQAYQAAFNAIVASSNNEFGINPYNFYGVVIDSKDMATQVAVADVVEQNKKFFGVSSNDVNIYNTSSTSDIAYYMSNPKSSQTTTLLSGSNVTIASTSFTRSFVVFTAKNITATATSWIEGAIMTNTMGATVAVSVYPVVSMYTTLQNFTYDGLTSTQLANLNTKQANVYTVYNNSTAVIYGKTSGGSWLDSVAMLAGR